jgi:hypothetical protein
MVITKSEHRLDTTATIKFSASQKRQLSFVSAGLLLKFIRYVLDFSIIVFL